MGEMLARRHFLEGAAAMGLALALARGQRLSAQEATVTADDELPMREVKLGLIGAGLWGKELLRVAGQTPNVTIATVCDSAEAEQSKVEAVAPGVPFVADYKAVLDDAAIEGVLIATPTHLHRQIVLDAIAAGKHVYCEAPLAITMDDLTAICQAARDAQVVFQPGLQRRCHPLTGRVKSARVDGSTGNVIVLRSQTRSRFNWMRAGATPERAKERSWKAYTESSLGPVGELGIHQIDIANNWIGGRPIRVQATGSQTTWRDAEWEVPDTVFSTLVYRNEVPALLESSVGSSHWGNTEELVGTEGTIFFRDALEKTLGYLFKEPGATSSGWEVYAKKEDILGELGLVMVATPPGGFDIQKIEHGDFGIMEPLYYALGSFAKRIDTGEAPMVTWQRGFEANVIAIRAAEAATAGTTIELSADDFKLA